jgi:hypothetical protein
MAKDRDLEAAQLERVAVGAGVEGLASGEVLAD